MYAPRLRSAPGRDNRAAGLRSNSPGQRFWGRAYSCRNGLPANSALRCRKRSKRSTLLRSRAEQALVGRTHEVAARRAFAANSCVGRCLCVWDSRSRHLGSRSPGSRRQWMRRFTSCSSTGLILRRTVIPMARIFRIGPNSMFPPFHPSVSSIHERSSCSEGRSSSPILRPFIENVKRLGAE